MSVSVDFDLNRQCFAKVVGEGREKTIDIEIETKKKIVFFDIYFTLE